VVSRGEAKTIAMNLLDFILITVLVVALVRGLVRGVIRQVASLLGIVAGFVVAGHLYLRLFSLLRSSFPSIPHLDLISYGALFAATWTAFVLLGLLAVRLSRVLLMGWADRILGALLGLLKGAVVAVVLVAMLTVFLPATSSLLSRSLLAPYVQTTGYYMVQLTPEELRRRYRGKHAALIRQVHRQKLTESVIEKQR
jgi:membrane protein required for colicin V production